MKFISNCFLLSLLVLAVSALVPESDTIEASDDDGDLVRIARSPQFGGFGGRRGGFGRGFGGGFGGGRRGGYGGGFGGGHRGGFGGGYRGGFGGGGFGGGRRGGFGYGK